MWILIWLLVSLFILGAFAWSLQTLFQQRKAWKAYAEKMKLTYLPGPEFLSSPSLSGPIGPYMFGLHTEQVQTNDSRSQRFSMIIEFSLRQGLPTFGAIGTAGMIPLINTLDMSQTFVPADKDWDATWLIRTRNAKMVEAYLTPVRLEVFKKVFRMKSLSTLFIFDAPDAVLRIETSDPLNNLERLEKIVKSLAAQIQPLIVGEDEMATLKAIAASPL